MTHLRSITSPTVCSPHRRPSCPFCASCLQPHQSKIVARLWSVLDTAKPGEPTLLAGRERPGPVCSGRPQVGPARGEDRRATRPQQSPVSGILARACFGLLGAALVPPLAAILRDRAPLRTESERELAATLLSDYASTQPDLLADLLMDADPTPFAVLLPVAQRQRAEGQADLAGRDLQEARSRGKRRPG